MRIAPFIAIQLSFLTTLASGQSVTSAIRAFELPGIWASDCGHGPGPQNEYSDFTVTSQGLVELHNDFGADYDRMVYRIVDAARLSVFRLSLRLVLATDDRIVLDTVTLRSGGRIRNWSTRLGTNILVDNGTMPSANGQETSGMTRCDMRRADRAPLTIRR
jgi:hypothetical protein